MEYCELYRREYSTQCQTELLSLLAAGQSCVLVVHSGGILDALMALVGPKYLSALCLLPLVVPGPRLQKYADDAGFKNIIMATSALAKDIEGALVDWYTLSSKKSP